MAEHGIHIPAVRPTNHAERYVTRQLRECFAYALVCAEPRQVRDQVRCVSCLAHHPKVIGRTQSVVEVNQQGVKRGLRRGRHGSGWAGGCGRDCAPGGHFAQGVCRGAKRAGDCGMGGSFSRSLLRTQTAAVTVISRPSRERGDTMLRIVLRDLMDGEDVLFGVAMGKQCFVRLLASAPEPETPTPVFLDFEQVASATVSFLREGPLAYRKHL